MVNLVQVSVPMITKQHQFVELMPFLWVAFKETKGMIFCWEPFGRQIYLLQFSRVSGLTTHRHLKGAPT